MTRSRPLAVYFAVMQISFNDMIGCDHPLKRAHEAVYTTIEKSIKNASAKE